MRPADSCAAIHALRPGRHADVLAPPALPRVLAPTRRQLAPRTGEASGGRAAGAGPPEGRAPGDLPVEAGTPARQSAERRWAGWRGRTAARASPSPRRPPPAGRLVGVCIQNRGVAPRARCQASSDRTEAAARALVSRAGPGGGSYSTLDIVPADSVPATLGRWGRSDEAGASPSVGGVPGPRGSRPGGRGRPSPRAPPPGRQQVTAGAPSLGRLCSRFLLLGAWLRAHLWEAGSSEVASERARARDPSYSAGTPNG